MNPRLTYRAIATTLAALGAAGTVACGGANPAPSNPVGAKEVPAASASPEEHASMPAEATSTQTEASTAAGASSGEAAKADAPADEAKPAEAPKTAEAATPAPTAKKKHKKGASASCGAGTCS